MARVIFSPFSARTLVLASITSHLNYLSTPLIRLPASILALFSQFSNEQLKLSCWNKSYHSNLCSKPPMPSPLTQSKCQCPLCNPRGPVGFGAPCVFGLTSQGSPSLCSMPHWLLGFSWIFQVPFHLGVFTFAVLEAWNVLFQISVWLASCYFLGSNVTFSGTFPDHLPASHLQHSLRLFSFYLPPEHV